MLIFLLNLSRKCLDNQRMNRFIRKAVVIYLALLILCSSLFSAASSRKTDAQLASVKVVFVESKADARMNRFATFLREELPLRGYRISDDREAADAILSASLGDIVVLDGEQPDPPQYVYWCLLLKGKYTLWNTEFKLRSQISAEDADHKGAIRIAERLDKAIKAAIKRTKKNP
jgi:hypothetical protein